jgi:AraC family transcriptional regulator
MTDITLNIKENKIILKDANSYQTDWHHHDDLQIMICLSKGVAEIEWEESTDETDGSTTKNFKDEKTVFPGQAIILPAHINHRISWTIRAHFILLRISADTICDTLCHIYEAEDLNIPPRIGIKDDYLYQSARNLEQTISRYNNKASSYYEAMIKVITMHVCEAHALEKQLISQTSEEATYHISSSQIACPKIQDSVHHINQHLERSIPIEELAKISELSPYYFIRTFKEMIGISPTRYHMMKRIDEAEKQLLQSDISIADLAYKLGFSSQSHFSKTFTKYNGHSPAHFRRNNQQE